MPYFRRTVYFRRIPASDMPAVKGQIFRHSPQLNRRTNYIPVRIAIRPASADPTKPRPAPHNAEVRFAESIAPTRVRENLGNRRRRVMSFADDSNHGKVVTSNK